MIDDTQEHSHVADLEANGCKERLTYQMKNAEKQHETLESPDEPREAQPAGTCRCTKKTR